jgi:hypothetical protein
MIPDSEKRLAKAIEELEELVVRGFPANVLSVPARTDHDRF